MDTPYASREKIRGTFLLVNMLAGLQSLASEPPRVTEKRRPAAIKQYTTNHGRGESKKRRKMAKASRRRNRGK